VELALQNLPPSPRSVILVADTLTDADVAYLKQVDAPLQLWVPGTADGGSLPESYADRGIDTRLNVKKFSEIRDAGLPVTLAAGDDSDLAVIQSHLEQSVTRQNNAREDLHWRNSGGLLVIPMLFLLYFWRRQIICVALVLPALFGSPPGEAAWLDAWIRPDVQGQQAFAAGRYREAAEHKLVSGRRF